MNRQEKIDEIYEVIEPTVIVSNGIIKMYKQIVMIGDVLDWIGEAEIENIMNNGNTIIEYILSLWLGLRKPLEDQSDETVSYVFDLISNNK